MRDQGGHDAARRPADVLEALVVSARPAVVEGGDDHGEAERRPTRTDESDDSSGPVPAVPDRIPDPEAGNREADELPGQQRQCRDDCKGPEPVLVEEPD